MRYTGRAAECVTTSTVSDGALRGERNTRLPLQGVGVCRRNLQNPCIQRLELQMSGQASFARRYKVSLVCRCSQYKAQSRELQCHACGPASGGLPRVPTPSRALQIAPSSTITSTAGRRQGGCPPRRLSTFYVAFYVQLTVSDPFKRVTVLVYTRIGSNKGKTPEHKQAKHTKHPHSLEWHNSTITIILKGSPYKFVTPLKNLHGESDNPKILVACMCTGTSSHSHSHYVQTTVSVLQFGS